MHSPNNPGGQDALPFSQKVASWLGNSTENKCNEGLLLRALLNAQCNCLAFKEVKLFQNPIPYTLFMGLLVWLKRAAAVIFPSSSLPAEMEGS